MASDQAEVPTWLKGLQAANAAPRCGARRKCNGLPCQGVAMPNGRCRMHGGASTGPRTAEGLARSKRSTWKHGGRSAEMVSAARDRGEARRLIAVLKGYGGGDGSGGE
jgi:hypothetical protein